MKGYFRKRGNTWSYTVDVGKDPATGKRKQKSKGGFKTKKEAQQALNEVMSKVYKGDYQEPEKMNIKEFMNEWLEVYAKNKVKETTLKNYKRAVDSRIVPALGMIQVNELKNHHAQKFVNDLIEEGLSARYIEYCMTVLHGAFENAVKKEILDKNPTKYVEMPRARKRDYKTWSSEQVKQFMRYAKLESLLYYPIFLTAVGTGMRRGELLGLTWDNIDFDKGDITVRQSLIYDEEGFRFSTPKTEGSIRAIALDDNLCKELKKHQIKQKEMKLLFGQGYDDHNLVFAREDGKPMYPRQLAIVFNRIIKQANVPKIRIHDLRHTHATLLLELGVNPKIVAERLGHSSVKITLDVYSHVTTEMQKDTAKKLEKFIY